MAEILTTLGILTLIILIHELGHYSFAKLFNVPVSEFSIGFPLTPKIKLFKYKETQFNMRVLPVGGFVSFGDGEYPNDPLSKINKSKRLAVLAAGSVFNIGSAYFIAVIAVTMSPNYELLQSFGVSLGIILDVSGDIYNGLISMFTTSEGYKEVSGIVGITASSTEIIQKGQIYIFLYASILSLSVGVFNLLPLPALDGGKILLLGVETFLKRPIRKKSYNIINAVEVIFIVTILLVTTAADIYKLL